MIVVVKHLAWFGVRDGLPAFPGDVKDDECYDQADDWVGDLESDRDDCGASQDAKAYESVNSGVVAVGDESRALKPVSGTKPDLCGDVVADEADHARCREEPQMRQVSWVDEALDRLKESDKSADEDGEYNGQAR